MWEVNRQARVVLADIDRHKRFFYGQCLGGDVGMQPLAAARANSDLVGLDLCLQLVGDRSG